MRNIINNIWSREHQDKSLESSTNNWKGWKNYFPALTMLSKRISSYRSNGPLSWNVSAEKHDIEVLQMIFWNAYIIWRCITEFLIIRIVIQIFKGFKETNLR